MNSNKDPLDIDLIIPKPNLSALTEGLRVGRYNLTTVIGKLNIFIRETLGTLEEFAEDQVKVNLENKIKIEKLDRSVSELTEQIQSMRQTIVFKDELVEEKKREIERYKVICEMSSNTAMRSINTRSNINFNRPYDGTNDNMSGGQGVSSLAVYGGSPMASQRPARERTTDGDDGSLDELIDCYYSMVKSPTQKSDAGVSRLAHDRHKHHMEIIGGVNIKGPRVTSGPVQVSKLIPKPNCDSPRQSQVKRVSVDLTNQSDSIMSSAENIAHQIRYKIHEKTAQRQVASGIFDRLSSRRKKHWPF